MRTGYAALLAVLSLSLTTLADCSSQFYLQDEWIGEDFYTGWTFETENDPTNGRVNYLSQADAQSKNLTYGATYNSSSARRLAESFIKKKWRTGRSLCARTMCPWLPPRRADVIASAFLLRRRTTTL